MGHLGASLWQSTHVHVGGLSRAPCSGCPLHRVSPREDGLWKVGLVLAAGPPALPLRTGGKGRPSAWPVFGPC